jgi:uncharacterized membrane-anchored protein YhcB (DUF1043 family)
MIDILIGFVVGVVVTVLIYRNNAKKFQKVVEILNQGINETTIKQVSEFIKK